MCFQARIMDLLVEKDPIQIQRITTEKKLLHLGARGEVNWDKKERRKARSLYLTFSVALQCHKLTVCLFIDPYWPWPSEEEEKEELFLSPLSVHVQSLLSSPFWSSAFFPKVVLEGTAKRHGLGVFLSHTKLSFFHCFLKPTAYLRQTQSAIVSAKASLGVSADMTSLLYNMKSGISIRTWGPGP
ncbi:hypothetical protein POTOM_031407 [Populus tomentosa]|uniref:Uncharacterized protein n=1 Tax=Populus tomentosa TaxID=118781 RepID=A0A8X8CRW1_POPTO|nr:hypothetical protein POTOM_031407 [Populus tomentosa]